MKKIIIVEDNTELREGYTYLINSSNANYQVINSFDNAEDCLLFLKTNKCDIVLMDIDLSGAMNGVQGTFEIKRQYPTIDVLIISVWESNEKVFNGLCAGASGYITKAGGSIEIINALVELEKGGAPMSPSIARMVIGSLQKNLHSPFTDNEKTCLVLLSEGKSYKTIAMMMSVGLDNVKYYIKKIYEKLQVHNKEDAISIAKQNNWI